LSAGRLADLPKSAHNVQAHQWKGGGAGERNLKFQADPIEIKVFLNDSPSLKGVECKRFSPIYQRVPFPVSTENLDTKHCDYFQPNRAHSKKEVVGRKNSSGSASTKKVCHCEERKRRSISIEKIASLRSQ